jgi:phosphodiesterase/alkaline phosphatase D-like protein
MEYELSKNTTMEYGNAYREYDGNMENNHIPFIFHMGDSIYHGGI